MPKQNPVTGFTPSHDLCAEIAQMAHGHIGFGCYGALHSNEDGDLADAGDKNIDLHDEHYIFEPEGEEGENHSDSLGGEGPGSKVDKKDDCFKADHPIFDFLLNRTPAKNMCCVRSEILTVRCHRGIKRQQAEDRKHQQFYGSLRVR